MRKTSLVINHTCYTQLRKWRKITSNKSNNQSCLLQFSVEMKINIKEQWWKYNVYCNKLSQLHSTMEASKSPMKRNDNQSHWLNFAAEMKTHIMWQQWKYQINQKNHLSLKNQIVRHQKPFFRRCRISYFYLFTFQT